MNLPDDIKLYIYSFLKLDDMKNIENDQELFLLRFKSENPHRFEDCHRILRNLLFNECFNCFNELPSSYIMHICGTCKFYIDKQFIYPLYCGNCIQLKKKRNFVTRFCTLCGEYSAFLGIEPYS